MLCRLNQDKLYNFVRSLLLGPHLQIHTCWIHAGFGSRFPTHILAPLPCLPAVAAAVHTVCPFPPQGGGSGPHNQQC